MVNRFDFYQEVEILSTCSNAEYIGKKAVIMGVSDADGIIYSYAITLLDGGDRLSLKPDCLKPTGKQFKREDFY